MIRPVPYDRPETVAAVADILISDPDAVLLAGGMTLIPTLKQGLRTAPRIVDLSGIQALVGIDASSSSHVSIGAMTTHAAVARSAAVEEQVPGLSDLAGRIGDAQVRNRGTIGGSVANNDPNADYPAALVALDAVVRTDRRQIPASAFFVGMFETALEDGEIITSICFPVCHNSAYAKLPHPISGFPMAGVFLARRDSRFRVGVTGAATSVYRDALLEDALNTDCTAPLLDVPAADVDYIRDVHGSAAYRAHLTRVMAERARLALAAKGNMS